MVLCPGCYKASIDSSHQAPSGAEVCSMDCVVAYDSRWAAVTPRMAKRLVKIRGVLVRHRASGGRGEVKGARVMHGRWYLDTTVRDFWRAPAKDFDILREDAVRAMPEVLDEEGVDKTEDAKGMLVFVAVVLVLFVSSLLVSA